MKDFTQYLDDLPIKVYVAGLYSADNVLEALRNIGRGEKKCAEIFNWGFAPFCPWHDKSYARDLTYKPLPVENFYKASLSWLAVSDAMLVISGIGEGGGVDAEIDVAVRLGMPIFHNLKDLVIWRDGNK